MHISNKAHSDQLLITIIELLSSLIMLNGLLIAISPNSQELPQSYQFLTLTLSFKHSVHIN